MKKWLLLLCVLSLSLFFGPGAQAQISTHCTYSAGSSQPTGVATDLVHGTVWVAMFEGNTLQEINATTCARVLSLGTGLNPNGVAFDASNATVWVANFGSNTVEKINSSSGTLVATYSVGTNPRGLTFDGTNVWVSNYGSNTVTRINATSGAMLTVGVGSGPYFLGYNTVDGNIYVPNRNSNTVTVIKPSTGAVLKTIAVDSQPQFVSTGDVSEWVSCYSSQKLDKISTTSLTVTLSVSAPHSGPTGITFDGGADRIVGVTNSGYVYTVDMSGNVGNVTSLGGNLYSVFNYDNFNDFSTNTGNGAVTKLGIP